jgi:hypothetical protein
MLGIALALTLAGTAFAQEGPPQNPQKQLLLDQTAAQENQQLNPTSK